jgi:ribonuclease P protein component
MLKKINRISKRKEFDDLRKNGGIIMSCPFFGVVIENKNDSLVKFGMVISKKISKKAVDRNKIKRRLMEVLNKNLSGFKKGQRILFLMKKEALKASVDNFEKEVGKLISKIG